jgi:multiple sugar transport system permease protein
MKSQTSERRQQAAGWALLAPALTLIGVFFFVPVLAGLVMSFTDFDIYSIGRPDTIRFMGFDNYKHVLADGEFWRALRNTLYFVVVGGPLSVAASLAAALLVNAKVARFKGFFRTVFFMPVVTTMVAVAIVFRYLLHPHYGLVNSALGFFHVAPIDWLGNPHWSMPAIVLLAVWKNFGYNMLIFIAGLQSIPDDLYEAAQLDGAGARAQFVHVTLPSLAPTFLFVGIMTMIGQFQIFAEPYVMTQGGPLRSTVSVVMLMYEQGFRWWRMGYATAIAFILFAIMMTVTVIQMKLQGDRGRS